MRTSWANRIPTILPDVERSREADRTRPDMETDMSGI